MSALLQLVQDMNNCMILFEWKGTVSPLTPGASSSSAPHFRNPVENNFQPKAILPRSWCKFCKENHEETTFEVKKSVRDKIFGKRPEATIIVLDFAEPEDVMVINTRNKAYAPKGKFDSPHTSYTPSSSSTAARPQVPKSPKSQRITPPLPSSKYNILNQLANIKADATLIGMVAIPKQQMHLKQFMEGKAFVVANLSEEVDKDDSFVNKVCVHNFRNPAKKIPFYISTNIMDKIAHCCLIDGGSGPSVMSKIIMEEIGLSCTNENARSMLSYNSLQQTIIGENKDETLVLCAHPEIRTTLREGIISPYIENVPQSSINYIEEDLGVYSIFAEEDNIPLEIIDLNDDLWHTHFDGSHSKEGNRVLCCLYV
jgi:hypothetical protein